MNEGIVYILTNPAMKGLVKIGMTTREMVDIRMAELYSTGVPVPFECSFAGRVADVKAVERAFHIAFGPYRINPNREFFEIEDTQAVELLKLMCIEDVSPSVKTELNKVDEVSRDSGQRMKQKRPNHNFEEMGIPVRSVLHSNYNHETCEVVDAKKVNFRGKVMSLTRATREMLELEYSVQPSPYWVYEGKILKDIYDETYGTVE
ncbi:GIY-YIG nuclease family protein [uncultured Roseivirga sp.]|uniref:GIY-YIG nuclease family protein n=1 Tax=uncultured Roseivirga sp. TaxID=543088 RepID=UPI000D796B11|nr:GIY-YIG nuclease family protein [uncultured Roseivirga sp.]PWL30741.1 MAG: hypothetical protein DCO95_04490 [Roseivirga sp. XM-24bin3]